MKKRLFSLLLLLLLLCGCAAPPDNSADVPEDPADSSIPSAEPAPDDPASDPSPSPEEPEEPVLTEKEAAVAALLAGMTLEEKVGQMFFVRCPEFDAVSDISAYHLGGYLLFGRDFQDRSASDIKDLLETFQAVSEIPLLIGVDEEGGSVVRISSNAALWPHKFSSPQRLYVNGGMEAVTADTEEKCDMLHTYGVNVNFAPVADVSTDPNDFMYSRTFGQDADATAEYVRTVVEAMEAKGVGSVLKHFPGYGNNADTHTGIAVDERPYETFLTSDFLPFEAGIAAGADSVLVSHNIVTAMDAELPASLSPEVHRVLREELGFTGVVLTDDLAMDAVAAYAADGSVAVMAVEAGNDMIVTTDYRTQIPLVIEAVEIGRIDEAVIDAAVTRVLSWKYDLGLIG